MSPMSVEPINTSDHANNPPLELFGTMGSNCSSLEEPLSHGMWKSPLMSCLSLTSASVDISLRSTESVNISCITNRPPILYAGCMCLFHSHYLFAYCVSLCSFRYFASLRFKKWSSYLFVIVAGYVKHACEHSPQKCGDDLDPTMVCMNTLNLWYSFIDVFSSHPIRVDELAPQGLYVIVNIQVLASIISRFNFFTLSDLQSRTIKHNNIDIC